MLDARASTHAVPGETELLIAAHWGYFRIAMFDVMTGHRTGHPPLRVLTGVTGPIGP